MKSNLAAHAFVLVGVMVGTVSLSSSYADQGGIPAEVEALRDAVQTLRQQVGAQNAAVKQLTAVVNTQSQLIGLLQQQNQGTLAAGRCWANRLRYVDCGNGTVTDQVTGLIWLKDSTCLGSMNYADANNAAQMLKSGECGLTDGSVAGQWRLPTLAEWQASIARAAALGCQPNLTDNSGVGCYGAAVDGPNPNQRALLGVTNGSLFWASTVFEANPASALAAFFSGCPAAPLCIGFEDPFNVVAVWPVRSGTF